MASQSLVLYQSPINGSSVYVNFDGNSLIASGLTLTCGSQATNPLIFYYTVNGVTTSLQANPGVTAEYTFSPPLRGTAGKDPRGEANISWQMSHGGGHGAGAPTPVTVVT